MKRTTGRITMKRLGGIGRERTHKNLGVFISLFNIVTSVFLMRHIEGTDL